MDEKLRHERNERLQHGQDAYYVPTQPVYSLSTNQDRDQTSITVQCEHGTEVIKYEIDNIKALFDILKAVHNVKRELS